MQVTRQRSKVGAIGDLAALITLLTGGFARLYKDDGFTPDANSLLADFAAHEADYTGYAAGGVALAAPVGAYNDGDTQVADNFPTIEFRPTGPVLVSNDIRGVFFEDSANDVQEYWHFEQPISMATVLDVILIDSKFVVAFADEIVDRGPF